MLAEALVQANQADQVMSLSFFGDEAIIFERCHMSQSPNIMVNLPTVELGFSLPITNLNYGALPFSDSIFAPISSKASLTRGLHCFCSAMC